MHLRHVTRLRLSYMSFDFNLEELTNNPASDFAAVVIVQSDRIRLEKTEPCFCHYVIGLRESPSILQTQILYVYLYVGAGDYAER